MRSAVSLPVGGRPEEEGFCAGIGVSDSDVLDRLVHNPIFRRLRISIVSDGSDDCDAAIDASSSRGTGIASSSRICNIASCFWTSTWPPSCPSSVRRDKRLLQLEERVLDGSRPPVLHIHVAFLLHARLPFCKS